MLHASMQSYTLALLYAPTRTCNPSCVSMTCVCARMRAWCEQERRIKNAGGYVVNIGGVHRVTNAAGAGAGLNLKVCVAACVSAHLLRVRVRVSESEGARASGDTL